MNNEHQIIDLSMMRIKRGTQLICRCMGEATYTIDPDCRKIYCNTCGAEVEAFDAMYNLVRRGEEYLERLSYLRSEISDAERKRRRTNLFRDLESQYMSKSKMFPICPQCKEPFRFEHIVEWICEAWALKRFSAIECRKQKEAHDEE